MRHCLGLATACLLASLGAAGPAEAQRAKAVAGERHPLRLETADGTIVDPFDVPASTRAVVFLFTSVECPISNRYAPEVARLHDELAGRGVSFWLVYPNPAESPAQVREHLAAYRYPVHALRDPRHELVKLAGATITPEAAVYDAQRRLAYRGRIDDRYVAIGVERPAATRRDLYEALKATLEGRPVAQPRLQAVGCYIADFVP
jgi:hypothetical protein